MTDTSILSAVLKRCSTNEQSRLQAALLSLNRCISELAPVLVDDEEESSEQQPGAALSSALASRFCSWAACAPRFVLLLTPSNKIVRSADRGRTWTALDVMGSSSTSATTTTTTTTTTTKIRLLTMDCNSTTGAIAVAGTHGFLAMSPSLGAPFATLTTGDTRTFESLFPPGDSKDQIFRRVFFNARGTVLFASTSSMICCCSNLAAAAASWTVLYRVPADKGILLSECTLLREDATGTTFEIVAFTQKTLLLFQVVSSSSSSSSAIARRLSIPVKVGSVLRCKEVALFAQSDRDHNSSGGVDSSTPLSSAAAFQRRYAACRSQFRPGLAPPATKASERRRRYDHTIGSPIPRAMVPSASEFFRSSVGPTASAATAATAAASELLDDLPEDDAFLAAFRGGLLPPDTVPRVFKCYCTGGEVAESDHTCWLWLWMGEDETADAPPSDDEDDDDGDDQHGSPVANAGAYSTATNVSYIPLVQSHPVTETVGLVVLDGGKRLVRASSAGVSSSADAGRTWTEPQLSCLVAAAALDSHSVLVASSRAAVATEMLSSESSSSALSNKKPRIHATKSQQQVVGGGGATLSTTGGGGALLRHPKWVLSPLAPSLGVSICTDIAVMN